MKLIIPMAGMGKRLRPHTLITPKPLLKFAGKALVERIVTDLSESVDEPFTEIHFIIGNFGSEVETSLLNIAKRSNAKGFIHYQLEPLGTAHAIFCAKEALEDKILIAFADTLFKGSFKIDSTADGVIWTMPVNNPENYGVVVYNSDKVITDFVEKPKDKISNNAIIGIYYFANGKDLYTEIDFLIKNNLRENNEFQLTNCLETLKQKGTKFVCAEIEEWLDCGNKNELIATHSRYLSIKSFSSTCDDVTVKIINPVYLGSNVHLKNCIIGPNVSIESDCTISNSIISDSLIYSHTTIENSIIRKSMVGNFCRLSGLDGVLDLGDYSTYEKI